MNTIIVQEDLILVQARLKEFEQKTGCELLLVVSDASDPYPGASTRFGIVGGFLLALISCHYFEFHHAFFYPIYALLLTLLMIWVGHLPWAKRLALSDWEVSREVQEKAIEFFHTLGTTKVTHKVTAMIMVSVFEKRIIIMVDEKLKEKISEAELDELVSVMQDDFKLGNMGLGFTHSIQGLEEKILKNFGGKVSDANPDELQDIIHFIHSEYV